MKSYIPYILAVVLIISGCSANHHLRRAKYHEKLAIAKGAVIKHDTVFIEKAVIVPEVTTDTIFKSLAGDTVRIEKDRLKIKYVRLPGDSVFIEGKCESDTVTITVPITITKEISAPKGFWYYFPWILVIIGVIAVYQLFRRAK
jgi:UDP-3-O-[3-hydroxymyristoyl] glucosamine N-acyltransferase